MHKFKKEDGAMKLEWKCISHLLCILCSHHIFSLPLTSQNSDVPFRTFLLQLYLESISPEPVSMTCKAAWTANCPLLCSRVHLPPDLYISLQVPPPHCSNSAILFSEDSELSSVATLSIHMSIFYFFPALLTED